MTEVTEEMILDYLVKKGGVVKNVDLVRHFRKHLQNESSAEKDKARVVFKERVNKVAFIKAEKQDKYLHIRPEYVPPGGLTRPPTGQLPGNSSNRNSLASLASLEDVLSGRSSKFDTSSRTVAASSEVEHKSSDSTPLPSIATTSSKATSSPVNVTPPTATTPPLGGKSSGKDFGSSLMEELDSFGSLLDSMGYKGSTSSASTGFTSVKTATPTPSTSLRASSGSGSLSSHTKPAASSYLANYEANSRMNEPSSPATPYTSATSHTPSPAAATNQSPPSTSSAPVEAPPSSDTPPSTLAGGSTSGKAVGLSTLTRFTSSKSHLNTSPSHNKPTRRRGQPSNNAEDDLTNLLSSLPSANPSNFGGRKPPSGAGKPPSGAARPPSGPSYPGTTAAPGYNNSTKFSQPPLPNQQASSYQNSTKFSQPSLPNQQQSGYQNSTKFTQPPLPNQQASSYQNSTKFSQPQAASGYQNSTKFSQPPLPNPQSSYQNSTNFSQPPLPNQQPSGFQNSTKFSQPLLPNQQRYQPAQTSQPPPSQQLVPQATPPSSSSQFNALAALSRNVPQATNPTPLPPVAPSYDSKGVSPRLSVLLSDDSAKFQQPPIEDNRSGGMVPVPQAQAKSGPPSAPPPAPVRTSSISSGLGGRGSEAGGGVSKVKSSSTSSTPSPSHATPRRVAPPPPPAKDPKDSPSRTSVTSQGSTAGDQKGGATSSPVRHTSGPGVGSPGHISHSPISKSGVHGSSTHTISSPTSSGRNSSVSAPYFSGVGSPTASVSAPVPLAVSNTALPGGPGSSNSVPRVASNPTSSSGLSSMGLGDLTNSMFSSIGGGLSGFPSSGGNSLERLTSSSGKVPPLNETASLPILPVEGSGGGAARQSHQLSLGPTVSLPLGGVADTLSRRNGSLDSTPSIRLDSAPGAGSGSGTSSPLSGRSQSPAAGGGGAIAASSELRGRTGSFQMAGATVGGVQMRNKPSRAGPGASVRRSRNLENKEALARLSVSQMTPPSVRKAQAPPDVAPKPMRRLSPSPARSREDLYSEAAEDVDDYDHDQEYDYIDPLEKEWILAAVRAELDTQLRLIATDSTLLNRKDFMHGYTGLHWAAKHGRMDILSMLLGKGAMVDIKSNGLTPLHLAAQAGHERVIFKLVKECEANINLREHGGRRPIDMLNNKVSFETKKLLSNLNNHGLPVRIEMTKRLCTFTQPRDENANLERVYAAVADVIQGTPVGMIDKDKSLKRKATASPRSTIRKSFSFKNRQRVRDQISPPKLISPAPRDIRK